MDTTPDSFPVFDHVRVGTPGLFPSLRLFQIGPLHISDLRDDDHLFTSELTALDTLAQDRADQAFAVAIHVIRRRVDEVHPFSQSFLESLSMFWLLRIDPIGYESQSRRGQPAVAELTIPMFLMAVMA